MIECWTRDEIERVAEEMFWDGTTNSERYSVEMWERRGWLRATRHVHRALSTHLKYLVALAELEGRPIPAYRSESEISASKIRRLDPKI